MQRRLPGCSASARKTSEAASARSVGAKASPLTARGAPRHRQTKSPRPWRYPDGARSLPTSRWEAPDGPRRRPIVNQTIGTETADAIQTLAGLHIALGDSDHLADRPRERRDRRVQMNDRPADRRRDLQMRQMTRGERRKTVRRRADKGERRSLNSDTS